MLETLLRIIVKLLFVPVFAFTLLAVAHEVTAINRNPPVNDGEALLELKECIETEYNIVFDITHMETYNFSEQARFIRGVAAELDKIPSELHAAVVSHLSSTNRVLVIQFVEEITGLSGEVLDFSGRYLFKEVHMQLRNTTIFIHEYGHMIHDVINDLYDANDFRQKWIEFAFDVDIDEFWCTNFVEGVAHAFVLLVDDNLTFSISASCTGSIDCNCLRSRECETESELLEFLGATINSLFNTYIF